MPEEKTISPKDMSTSMDAGAGIDFFGPAKETTRKIAGSQPSEPGAEFAYGEEELDVFGKSRQLEDEELGDGKKKGKQQKDSEEYDDIEGADDDSAEGDSDSEDNGGDSDDDREGGDDDSDDSAEDDDSQTQSDSRDTRLTKGYTLIELDGEQVKIPDSTKIAIAIDGEKQVLTLGKLKQLKAGEVSYNRKFTELGEERKKLKVREEIAEKEVEQHRPFLTKAKLFLSEIQKHIEQGSFEDILTDTYMFFGKDPEAFWNHYEQVNANYFDQFNKLDENSKAAARMKRGALLKEAALAKREQFAKKESEVQQFEAFKERLIKEQPGNFTKGDVLEAWAELEEAHKLGRLDQNLASQLKAASPEARWRYALAYATEKKTDSRIAKAVERAAPKYKDKIEKINELLRKDVKIETLLSASEKDLEEMVRVLTGGRQKEQSSTQNNKGSKTTNSLRDKAQPRHTARGPQKRAEGESYITPGKDIWGVQFDSSRMLRGSR